MSNSFNSEETIQSFLERGGEITMLSYAGQKTVNRAGRMAYHRDRAMNGDERSKSIVSRADERESMMIFSKTERHMVKP
jgi:hypothetical protein